MPLSYLLSYDSWTKICASIWMASWGHWNWATPGGRSSSLPSPPRTSQLLGRELNLISGCAKFESTNLNQHPRYPQKYSWISYPLGQRAVLPDDMSIMSWKHWFVRCKASVYDSTYTLEVSCLAGCDSNLVNATQAQCHNVLDMLSTVKVSVTNCSSNSSNCSNVQRHSSNLHPIFIQSSWFAREDSGSRSAWRLNAIHRNLMLPAGPQRGQATSPNTKIIKNILKPRWCFISFMPFLCHFVIFIYFYVQLDFVVPSFKSLLGHIRVLRGQIEVTFHCECCTAAEWPWLVCQLGCLAIATRRSAACHAMRTAAMRSVEVCRSVSKCVEVSRPRVPPLCWRRWIWTVAWRHCKYGQIWIWIGLIKYD